jgi:4-hydroxyproline epimerase
VAGVQRIRVVDSHTEGEPTRVVIDGAPPIDRFRAEHDHLRAAIVDEPRGSDILVGALLGEPRTPGCAAAVLFFNNVGYLGMCGHGAIGVIVTLAHLGRIGPGVHRLETPVGVVSAELHRDGRVTIANVPSYRAAAGVRVDVPGHGTITGDVAWGGNWFFLTESPLPLERAQIPALTDFAWRVRRALGRAEIDHIELTAGARNFVLCPGGAYDRSPCGTGTSAKLACLAADGALAPGERWRQESILGTSFDAVYEIDPADPHRVLPSITGRAYVIAESTLLLDPRDPLWPRRS